ncbi:MAG: cytochrome c, partial [Pseudomonadota bacterium]
MNKWFPFSTLIAGLVLGCYVQSAQAEGNPAAGKKKSATCVACHNADGNSTNPAWPKLAGQHANYLVSQLKAFKQGPTGPRNDPVMYGMVQNLSDK